jgi:hypothetical protein
MTYKYSINDFAEAPGGSITTSGNGVKLPHPFDESRNIPVYPNRDIKSKIPFFIQIDDDERSGLKRHLSAILDAMGAGKWPDELTPYFKGADVCILPDSDKSGAGHANLVATKLQNIAKRVRVLELPGRTFFPTQLHHG